MSENESDKNTIDEWCAIRDMVHSLPGETVVEKVRGMKAVIDKLPMDADGNSLIPQPRTVYTFNAEGEIYWVNVDWMTWHSAVNDDEFNSIDHWSVSGRDQFDEHSNIEAKECYLTRESAEIGYQDYRKRMDAWESRAAAQKAAGNESAVSTVRRSK